jgi:Domain of unknown function (DUF4062)
MPNRYREGPGEIQYCMAKSLTELIVFISCPSDLEPERRAIQSAVEELNPLLSETRSVILRAICWDKDLLPGIGPDVQSVINQQIEGKYDVYIGLLGTKFGTRTPRALSGTEEEFEAAFKRYAASPESVRLLFYFRSTATNIQHLDANQLAKVHTFRNRLGDLGVLYRDFADEQQLLKLVREHLGQLVSREWDGKKWRPPHGYGGPPGVADIPPSSGPSIAARENLIRPGIVDCMYTVDLEMGNIVQVLNSMKDAEAHLWGAIQKSQTTSTQLKDGDVRGLKAVVDTMADDLAQFIDKMAADGLALKGNLRAFVDAIESAISLYFEERHGGSAYLADAPAHLASLINGISTARENLKQLRQILELIPDYTSRFTATKRTAAPVFADVSGNMAVQIGHLQRILQDLLYRLKNETS